MRRQKCKITSNIYSKKEKFTINRGKYKGLGLFLESNKTTRPTKALVKKSFFDTMQHNLYGKTFVECFAGSGQMGFEALSIGATQAIFFENNSRAFENLCGNINLFWEKHARYHKGMTRDSMHTEQSSKNAPISIQAFYKDCLQSKDCLADSTKNADFQVKNDIIPALYTERTNFVLYMDPPFACRSGFEDIYTKICRFIESFDETFIQKIDMVVIESMSSSKLDTRIRAFHLAKKSKFGQTTLMYFTK